MAIKIGRFCLNKFYDLDSTIELTKIALFSDLLSKVVIFFLFHIKTKMSFVHFYVVIKCMQITDFIIQV